MADFEMRHISKSFGNVKALEYANFSANKGDVMGLLGENGAGKSTLIKILCGVEREDEGEVVLFGKKMLRRTPKEAMEEGVRVVHQELSLIANATVAENLFMTEKSGLFQRENLKKLNARAEELFGKYGVTDLDADAYVSTLPLAKCQKIEILKALSGEFDILVLDEATSALTEKDVEWLFELVRKLSAEKKIIIFISHRLQEINSICQRITVFRNGTSVCESDRNELDTDQMVTLMLGRKRSGYYPERQDMRKEEVLLKAERGEIDPLTITADQYDLVCNGVELSSGAVRNHDPEIMIKAFELVRLGEADVKKKFPAMYNAFTYGAPPHAGIAPGVDRMVMLLAGEESIREIIPFPMNKNAQDILMGAPSEVTQKQLDELHIVCTAKEEE